jgi:hypothetical protein
MALPAPPTASPGEGRVWAYNYQLKKYDSVKAGADILNGVPYVEPATPSTPFTPGPGQDIWGSTPPRTIGIPTVNVEADMPAEDTVDEDTTMDDEKTQPGPKPEPIDWEAIVAAIEVNAIEAAKELYGGFYALIEQNEEIKKLILDAYTQKWDSNKFAVKLRDTEWWKTTADAARKFDIDEQLDPASTNQRINEQALKIQEMAMAKGVRLNDVVTRQLAYDSLRMGWDNITLANSVGAEILKAGPSTQLSQGYIGNKIRGDALKYGIRLSDSTFTNWTEKILTGQSSDQMYNDYLLNQAKMLYPALSNGFDRGLSFGEMTDPYAQQASRLLEIPTGQIDFTDPKWAAAFSQMDKDGNQRQMTYSEWDRYLKTTPAFGFEYTDQARNQAFDLVGRIGRLFGAA